MSGKLRLCTLSFASSLLLGMATQLMAYGFDECYYLQWGYDYSEPYYRSADPSAGDQSSADQSSADQSSLDQAAPDPLASDQSLPAAASQQADETAMTPRDGYGDGYDSGLISPYSHSSFGNYYLWYCQARPHGARTWDIFIRERFHSYKPVRLDARDQALFRCERYTGRCEARCALAPRVCAPHFWP